MGWSGWPTANIVTGMPDWQGKDSRRTGERGAWSTAIIITGPPPCDHRDYASEEIQQK
jgi:hypothetical protein